MTRFLSLLLVALCLLPLTAQACAIQVVQPYFTAKTESDAKKFETWISRNRLNITREKPESLRYFIGPKIPLADAGVIQQAGIKTRKIYGVALPTDAKVKNWGGLGSCE